MAFRKLRMLKGASFRTAEGIKHVTTCQLRVCKTLDSLNLNTSFNSQVDERRSQHSAPATSIWQALTLARGSKYNIRSYDSLLFLNRSRDPELLPATRRVTCLLNLCPTTLSHISHHTLRVCCLFNFSNLQYQVSFSRSKGPLRQYMHSVS